MVTYKISLKRELTLKIEQKKYYNNVGKIYPTFFFIAFNIKMHIYTLYFANPRIINVTLLLWFSIISSICFVYRHCLVNFLMHK